MKIYYLINSLPVFPFDALYIYQKTNNLFLMSTGTHNRNIVLSLLLCFYINKEGHGKLTGLIWAN